jgi:CBS domain-containing protein
VFNLVPGFPLDGGRLLRSAIWKATGSLSRATRIASVSGQAVGWLLVAGGVAFLLAGDLAGGIWFAFIGWFLVQAARSSYQELQLRNLLRGVEAEDVMAGSLLRIPPDLTLQQAVDGYFMRYDHSAFPVDEHGRTVGLLTLRGVRRVPRERWPSRRVREHMVPLGDQVVVAPDARMDAVLAKLEDGDAGRVLVVQDGEVVGIITPTDLTRWLRRWRTLDIRRAEPAAHPVGRWDPCLGTLRRYRRRMGKPRCGWRPVVMLEAASQDGGQRLVEALPTDGAEGGADCRHAGRVGPRRDARHHQLAAAAAWAGCPPARAAQLLYQLGEGLRPARVAQHHVVAGGDGQPGHGTAEVATADEADRRHAPGNPGPGDRHSGTPLGRPVLRPPRGVCAPFTPGSPLPVRCLTGRPERPERRMASRPDRTGTRPGRVHLPTEIRLFDQVIARIIRRTNRERL